jgi:hypothetical protein
MAEVDSDKQDQRTQRGTVARHQVLPGSAPDAERVDRQRVAGGQLVKDAMGVLTEGTGL